MANTPQSPDNVRLTITVTPEVHATFKRLAAASNASISRAMGEWLADTLDAADAMTAMMERARKAPKLAIQEMHSFALGLGDETGAMLKSIREKSRASSAQVTSVRAGPGPTATGTPRPVIRGVKSPSTPKPGTKGRAS